jgi:hypothetical protein
MLAEPARPTPAPTLIGLTPSAVPVQVRLRPSVPIGASLVARSRRRRTWIIPVIAGPALVGSALALIVGRSHEAPAPRPTAAAPAPTKGTLKLLVEPTDAEARIDNQTTHVGTPWSLELATGVHQVEIHRTGYKTWLTSIELTSDEKQTLRVALEPLGDATPAHKASLSIRTTPPGLEVILDHVALADRTPLHLEITPGPHAIAVRENGTEVWRRDFVAAPDSDNEFTPPLAVSQGHSSASASERTHQVAATRPPASAADLTTTKDAPAAAAPPSATTTPPATPATQTGSASPTPPVVPPPAPARASEAPSPATAPVAHVEVSTAGTGAPPPAPPLGGAVLAKPPVPVLAPNAVTKLSGDLPTIATHDVDDLPKIIELKLCIDTSGHVTSADVLTKGVDRRPASMIVSALRGWTYAPYRNAGSALPACFTVALRVK